MWIGGDANHGHYVVKWIGGQPSKEKIMNTITNIAECVFFLLLAALFFYMGAIRIINPQEVINSNIKKMTCKNVEPNFLVRLSTKILRQKWSLYNERIGGIVMIFVGLLFIFLTIAKIRNPDINRKTEANVHAKPIW